MQNRTALRRILLRTNLPDTADTQSLRQPIGRLRRPGRRLAGDSLCAGHARVNAVGDAHR